MTTTERGTAATRAAHPFALDPPRPARRPSPWMWLVAVSIAALAGTALVLGAWWALTRETRVATYRVVGDLAGVELDVAAADVTIDGGGVPATEVRRTDRFAFGRDATERRGVRDGVLRVSSRCPDTVLGDCRTAYRLTVPDNVPVTVRTTTGSVRMDALRASASVATGSGPVTVEEFCGFSLRAVSTTGAIRTSAECSPERLELRSGSGDVTVVVPRGRYELDAQSDAGARRVRGLTQGEGAPFRIQVLSRSGDVMVEGGA